MGSTKEIKRSIRKAAVRFAVKGETGLCHAVGGRLTLAVCEYFFSHSNF